MKRSGPIPRRTPLRASKRLQSSGRIKPKKRTASEYNRIYGSKARVQWVKSQPCAACRAFGTDRWPIQNHHIRTAGTSRKADYDTIIPLCHGCHSLWHEKGQAFVETLYDFIAENRAAETEAGWQAASHQQARRAPETQ